jgi:hypothetical protein
MTVLRLASLLDYECLFSTLTDLVLIYESITSSPSVVRWLTLHSWTRNLWILLRLNGLTPLESELLYDWRFTANQFVLAPNPFRLTARIFFLKWTPAVIGLI